jgi:DHA2 family multidrug resistance protein
MMPITGYLLGRRWDPRWMLGVGLVVASVAFFAYSGLNLQAGPSDFLAPQIVQGIGMALVFVPLTTITMDPIPLASTGYATSIYSLVRNVGSSIGISFVTTMVARRAQFHQARLVEAISAYEPGVRNTLDLYRGAMRGAGAPPGAAGREGLGLLYGQVVQQANLMAFVDLFYLLGILFLLVVPIVWFMRRPRQKSRGAAAAH